MLHAVLLILNYRDEGSNLNNKLPELGWVIGENSRSSRN